METQGQNEIGFTVGGTAGLIIGGVTGVIIGFFGPLWGAWEGGKAIGEQISLSRTQDAMHTCRQMMQRGPINDIQQDYCAELIGRALGEIE